MKIKEFGPGTEGATYVGIDQSYSGFAITFIDKEKNFYSQVYKDDGAGIDRLLRIKKFLMKNTSKKDHLLILDVAMEGYAFGSQRANMLGELGGMVKLCLLEELGVYPLLVPPTSLKKYATGQGTKVSKSQIMLSVYKKWGVDLPDDDAADSYVLARIVAGMHETAYEKEIYTKLQDPKFREK